VSSGQLNAGQGVLIAMPLCVKWAVVGLNGTLKQVKGVGGISVHT
jgi:hypothetical protein